MLHLVNDQNMLVDLQNITTINRKNKMAKNYNTAVTPYDTDNKPYASEVFSELLIKNIGTLHEVDPKFYKKDHSNIINFMGNEFTDPSDERVNLDGHMVYPYFKSNDLFIAFQSQFSGLSDMLILEVINYTYKGLLSTNTPTAVKIAEGLASGGRIDLLEHAYNQAPSLFKEGKIIKNLIDTTFSISMLSEFKMKAIKSAAPEAGDFKNCLWLGIAAEKKAVYQQYANDSGFTYNNQDVLDYYEQNQDLCSHYDDIMQYHSILGDNSADTQI